MNNFKFKLNRQGVRELLKSAGVASECKKRADAVASRAGEGFVSEARNYPERSGYAVRPDTGDAYYKNLNENTLLKVLR